MTRSPWWLIGFGLFGLVSLNPIAKCQMPSSAVFSLLLCDVYFLVAFGVIVSDKNASAWWLTVALFLEAAFAGYAQNQVEEDEKKSKIARETEKRLADEKRKAAQTVKGDEAGEKETEVVKSEVKRKRKTSGTKKTEIPKKISETALKNDVNDDGGDETKIDDAFQEALISDLIERTKKGEYVDQVISEWFESIHHGVMSGNMKEFDKLNAEAKSIILNRLISLWIESDKQLRKQGLDFSQNAIAGLVAGTLFAIRVSIGLIRDPLTEKLFAVMAYFATPLFQNFVATLPVLKEKTPEVFIPFEDHAMYDYFGHLTADTDYGIKGWSDMLPYWVTDNHEDTFSQFVRKRISTGSSVLEEIASSNGWRRGKDEFKPAKRSF